MWLFEMASLSGFFYWFGAVVLAGLPSWKLRAIFLLVSFMTSSPLHLMVSALGQITADRWFISNSGLIQLFFPPPLFDRLLAGWLQIVQSHYSRSMEDMGVMESHSQHNLRTTMDVSYVQNSASSFCP